MKEKVFNLLKNTKCFEDVLNVLNNISAENGGVVIRKYILEYMEENFPKEFEDWILK